jgi:hypothetical protein
MNDKPDPRFAFAEKLSAHHWDEFLKDDPELGRIELKIARAARMLSTEYLGSIQHAEALKEWHYFRERRKEILDKRYPR